jgi:acyl-homoserine lactone acylase PvdQ
MGSFIKDGRTDIYKMGEFLNKDEKPKLFNPSKGYISMANNRFASNAFEFRSSLHEIVTGRAYRIQNLIE